MCPCVISVYSSKTICIFRNTLNTHVLWSCLFISFYLVSGSSPRNLFIPLSTDRLVCSTSPHCPVIRQKLRQFSLLLLTFFFLIHSFTCMSLVFFVVASVFSKKVTFQQFFANYFFPKYCCLMCVLIDGNFGLTHSVLYITFRFRI